jgi:hypothetical protein
MAMELDPAGGAVTTGVIAAAVEKPAGKTGQHQPICADCGAETSGRFCSNCGQATHTHRTLLHLGEEILHGVMHFDSRVWRTLPLLFLNPGRLTREWVLGKRTRYVSPLGMYLFTVFVMFMLLSFMPVNGQEALQTAAAIRDTPESSGTKLFRASNAIVQAELALENGPKGRDAASVAERARLKAQVDLAEKEMAAADAAMDANPTAPNVAVLGAGWAQQMSAAAASGELAANTGNKELDKKLSKKLQNPELALYKIQQTFYKFSFLLIPISIPFVAILFLWKRGFTLYDHGVFVLYSLTFMALLIMAAAGLIRVGGPVASMAAITAMLIVPVHMFAQVKGAYGLSIVSALWRTFMLLVFCSVALSLFLLAVVMLGVAG